MGVAASWCRRGYLSSSGLFLGTDILAGHFQGRKRVDYLLHTEESASNPWARVEVGWIV